MYIYIYIYIYTLVQFVWHITHVDFCHVYSMLYTIDYLLYGQTMETTVQTYYPLLFPLLLLLVVIYGGVVTYNKTATTNWYVDDDDVGLWQRTCCICYHVCANPFPQG